MTECRKVQELTKEFLKKLLKVKKFKEMVISNKINNRNYEPKRIRAKNNNSNTNNDINNLPPFSLSDGIKKKHLNPPLQKILPLMNPLFMEENVKEKDFIPNTKISQRRLPKIEKPKTSEKFKEKEKIFTKTRKYEERKNDKSNIINNSNSNDFPKQLRPKEEEIKKIKIISKIEDDLYERLLNRHKIKRISSSESKEVKVRANSFDNNLTFKGSQSKSK